MQTVNHTQEKAKNDIVDAIKRYQQRHPGWSPSDDLLSREAGLSVREVKYLITILEREGRVGVVGQWPRTLWVRDEEEVADEVVAKVEPLPAVLRRGRGRPRKEITPDVRRAASGRKYVRKGFLSRAKDLAQVLVEEEAKGIIPEIREISEKLYGHRQTGYVSTLVKHMQEEGWVSKGYKQRRDIKLTQRGRDLLLPKNTDDHPIMPELREANTADDENYEIQPPTEALRDLMATPPAWEPEVGPAGEERAAQLRQEIEPLVAYREIATSVADDLMARIETVTGGQSLKGCSDADLVLECVNRGFKISR